MSPGTPGQRDITTGAGGVDIERLNSVAHQCRLRERFSPLAVVADRTLSHGRVHRGGLCGIVHHAFYEVFDHLGP
jgi:hypothetical protein